MCRDNAWDMTADPPPTPTAFARAKEIAAEENSHSGEPVSQETTHRRETSRRPPLAASGSRVSLQRSRGYTFDVLRTNDELRSIEHEWLELFERSLTRNPFSHPAWVTAWLQHFVPDERGRLVVVARSAGEVVGVAPFHSRPYRLGPVKARCLQLAGGSPTADDPLTEMSEILVARDGWRATVRAIVGNLIGEHADGYDWIGLTMPPDQGWFDDEWVPEDWQRGGAFTLHKGIRPFVVLPLPASWEELSLKRNVKEAIRRSKNRLAALEGDSQIVFVEGGAVADAAAQVQTLHRMRAEMTGHLPHDDYFENDAFAAFARDACAGLAATGHAAVALSLLDSQPIAGRVVLHAHGSAFLSYSGTDPAHWELGAATGLIEASIRAAIARRDDSLNFSGNPDPAKLRWSERLEFHNEFIVVAPSRRARAALSLFWQARARRSLAGRRQTLWRRNGY